MNLALKTLDRLNGSKSTFPGTDGSVPVGAFVNGMLADRRVSIRIVLTERVLGLTGATDLAARVAEKDRTGRAPLTKANMVAGECGSKT